MKYLHKGRKININFVKMILQYPHFKHKMLTDFLDGLCIYPNIGHKICMFNEKMMTIKK
jgi:hypothetical protein